VRLALVEQADDLRTRLVESLEREGVRPDKIVPGRLEDALDELLDRYDRRAVLVFVDPFGLAIDRTTLERVLRARSSRRPVDVIYHFSVSAVARMGRAAVLGREGAESNAAQLDGALGSIDWRTPFLHAEGPEEPTSAAVNVARLFKDAVRASTGIISTTIPVRQRPDHLPKYLLMLFSANDEAHWDSADQAGKARVDWLHHCDTEDYEANVRDREEHGVLTLFDEQPPERDRIDQQVASEAESSLRDHIRELLTRRADLRPVDAVEAVYGDHLGRARTMHVRSALKALYLDGEIDDDGKGEFWFRTIRRRVPE
jgi:three-Cys-motif partner protein